MKKSVITILSVAAFLGGFLIFYQNRPVEQKASISEAVQQTNSPQKWESKTDDQANVTVVVTPIDLSSQSTEWKFKVVMDTHSVELDQDLVKTTVLVNDQGKEYKPINWDGPVGGHHREGALTFNRIIPTPKSVELKISGIGGVIRTFSWQLK